MVLRDVSVQRRHFRAQRLPADTLSLLAPCFARAPLSLVADSPNLRIKPRSSRATGAGRITQLNVETYGGGLWHTWFDRDLSVAGRVILEEEGGTYRQVLVDLKKPICRIPSLCIHLQTGEERAAFKVNKEDHLQPIFQQAVSDTLEKVRSGEERSEELKRRVYGASQRRGAKRQCFVSSECAS